MKPTKLLLLLVSLSAGLSILVAQQPAPPDGAAPTPPAAAAEVAPAAAPAAQPAVDDEPDPVLRALRARRAAETGGMPDSTGTSSESVSPSPSPSSSSASAAAAPESSSDIITAIGTAPEGEGLTMNFINAPLDRVLNFLSDAAGFIIVKEVQPRGTINIVSKHPMTKDEAVKVLHSALLRANCGAIRTGRTLTIVNADELKTRGIPVSLWNGDPESIPQDDVMVTMILPVRFVQVAELLQNIIPLVNPSTPLTANQSGNSLIITDTQNNIRRIAEIIKAVDAGAEDVTVVQVFKLTYASPSDVADQVANLFGNRGTGAAGAMAPMMTGGRGGRGGAGNARARTRTSVVVAVPDMRTSSVIVTASQDLMENIANTIAELDESKARNQEIYTFSLQNVEPAEALQVLTDIFQKSGTSSRNNNNSLNNALVNRVNSNNQSYGSSSSRSSTGSRTSGMGGGGRTGGTGGGGMGGGSFGG